MSITATLFVTKALIRAVCDRKVFFTTPVNEVKACILA
jgi:hypothetical protein